MKIIATNISDVLVIEPVIFGDERGFFFESLISDLARQLLVNGSDWNSVNTTKSSYGYPQGWRMDFSY